MARVLVADNDKEVNLLLTQLLRAEGHDVVSVGDGMQAVAALSEPMDLLVCDLDMPELDGFGVLRRLADAPAPPQVLIITGYADAGVERQLEACTLVRRVWRKPFDLGEFLAHVAELCGGSSVSREVGW